MKIFNYNPNKYIFKTTSKTISYTMSPLSPLPKDTVSFCALKKTKFEGIDLAVVEKFKAPIEKFNSNEDLQNWAGQKVESIANKDFGGRQKETKIQRKLMLKVWTDYLLKENDFYNNATALLVLDAVTKDLKPDNDKLPPVLNKGVLADCISEIDKNTISDRKYQFNLNKMYETKLRAIYLEDTKNEDKNTGWIVIPSKENDPENFDSNIEKLKLLSCKNWCTESYNTEQYLSQGDFHVYLENKKPKLGIRFIDDKIYEIQGEMNNYKIPVSYFDELQKYIEKNNFKLTSNANEEIEETKNVKEKIERIKTDLESAIKNKDAKAIFEYFNIRAEEDKDGFLTISKYNQPSVLFTFADIGIDENELFKKVKGIRGNADFCVSQIINLGVLETIGGWANFFNSQVKDLGNLKSIDFDVYFKKSQVKSLGNLESIGGDANFYNSLLTDLGKLETVGGDVCFSNSQIKNLGNLETIGGNVDFIESQVENLGNLETIGGNANFTYSQVENLGNLKSIGGNANFNNSRIENLGNLETIGGDVRFNSSQIKNLGNLKSIGGNVNFYKSPMTNLGKLETIGGDAGFNHSQITNLCNLKSIGGDADFNYSQITDLGNLETIGGDADFNYSQVTDLGNLKSIGNIAWIVASKLVQKDFENIKVAQIMN